MLKKKRSSIQFIDPSQNANQLSLKMKKYVYLNEMAISFIFQFIQLVQSELDTHRNKKDSVVLSQCDLFRKNVSYRINDQLISGVSVVSKLDLSSLRGHVFLLRINRPSAYFLQTVVIQTKFHLFRLCFN